MSANHMPPALGAILTEHDRGPEYALVECIAGDVSCSAKERVENSARMTDEEITAVLAGRGWSVGPTLCPAHRNQPDQEGTQQ